MVELKPGWQLLQGLVETILSADFYDQPDHVWRVQAVDLINHFHVRARERFPAKHSKRLVYLAAEAAAKVLPHWDKATYCFFFNHGGEAFLCDFLARHPEYVRTCSEGELVIARLEYFEDNGIAYEGQESQMSVAQ